MEVDVVAVDVGDFHAERDWAVEYEEGPVEELCAGLAGG